MPTKKEMTSSLNLLENNGITIQTTGRLRLNFYADENSQPFTSLIELRSKEDYYLVKALAEIKNIDKYQRFCNNFVMLEMPDYQLQFMLRF